MHAGRSGLGFTDPQGQQMGPMTHPSPGSQVAEGHFETGKSCNLRSYTIFGIDPEYVYER